MALTKVPYTDYQTVVTAQNLNDIQDEIISTTGYTTSDTTAAVAAKSAVLANYVLSVGASVKVKFTYSNTAADPTLNVQTTGAKPIVQYGGTPVGVTPATSWTAGEVLELVYDGTNYVIVGRGAEISDLISAVDAVDAKADNISDAYDATATYKVGQYCIYDNTLYRCTTAITTAEAWTASHWTATTISEEIENRVIWQTGVTVSATSGNIVTFNDSRITPDHVLANVVFTDNSKITALSSWSTQTAGRLTIAGTCTAATTAEILLIKKDN